MAICVELSEVWHQPLQLVDDVLSEYKAIMGHLIVDMELNLTFDDDNL